MKMSKIRSPIAEGERLVPRLKHAPGTILESAPERLRSDASYLIAGGLGVWALRSRDGLQRRCWPPCSIERAV